MTIPQTPQVKKRRKMSLMSGKKLEVLATSLIIYHRIEFIEIKPSKWKSPVDSDTGVHTGVVFQASLVGVQAVRGAAGARVLLAARAQPRLDLLPPLPEENHIVIT